MNLILEDYSTNHKLNITVPWLSLTLEDLVDKTIYIKQSSIVFSATSLDTVNLNINNSVINTIKVES
jgi:hypothetical protein